MFVKEVDVEKMCVIVVCFLLTYFDIGRNTIGRSDKQWNLVMRS